MATSDLLNELPKDTFRLDAEGERRVCQARGRRVAKPPRVPRSAAPRGAQAILKQMSDASADIQNLAIKWCAPAAAGRAATCVALAIWL